MSLEKAKVANKQAGEKSKSSEEFNFFNGLSISFALISIAEELKIRNVIELSKDFRMRGHKEATDLYKLIRGFLEEP